MPTASTGWTELPVCPVTVRVPPGAPGPGSARVTACTIGTAAPTPGVRSTVERTLSSRPPRDVAPTTRRGAGPPTCDAKSAKERDTLVVVTATDTTRATPAAAATAPRTVRTGCRTSLRRLSRRNRRISASGHVAVAQVQHPPCPPGGALVVGRHEQGGPDLEHLGPPGVEHLLAGPRVDLQLHAVEGDDVLTAPAEPLGDSVQAKQTHGNPQRPPQRYGCAGRLGSGGTARQPHSPVSTATYFVERYSSMPSLPPSRPKPDCFTPPKGAAGFDTSPRLSPII